MMFDRHFAFGLVQSYRAICAVKQPSLPQLVVYASAGNYGSCVAGNGVVAYAGRCTYDQYKRPTTGYINICGDTIDKLTGGLSHESGPVNAVCWGFTQE